MLNEEQGAVGTSEASQQEDVSGGAGPGKKSRTAPKKLPQPTQTLPTDRIQLDSQLAILRAYAAAGGAESKAVSNNEVAKILGNAPSTVSLCNKFWADMGLLNKSNAGWYSPSEDVRAYNRAAQWKSDDAAHKLARTLRNSWFFKAIEPTLRFRSLTTEEALTVLADESNAHPDYKGRLVFLVDLMKITGLITELNGEIKTGPLFKGDEDQPTTQKTVPKKELAEEDHQSAIEPHGPNNTPVSTADGIRFNVAIDVSMAEMAGWDPARISAFFAGLAQVLAAKQGGTDADTR